MSDNKFDSFNPDNSPFDDDEFSLTGEDGFRDSFDDDDKFDNFDKFSGGFGGPGYDDDFDGPLTSRRSSFDGYEDYDDEDSFDSGSFDADSFDKGSSRGMGRRETIERMAREHKDGNIRPRSGNNYMREMPVDPRTRKPSNQQRNKQAARNRMVQGHYDEKQKSKSKFAAFYIGMLVLAVGVCLAVFFVVLQTAMDRGIGRDVRAQETPNQGNQGVLINQDNEEASVIGQPDLRTISALIISTEVTNPRHLTVLDISNRRTREFVVPDTAAISNRTGQGMTFFQLRTGQLVDINYNSRNEEVATIRESTHSWERRARTNAYISLEDATITLGEDVYNFSSHTIVMRHGEPFHISQITPLDTITMSGFGTDVWMIQLELSHGFLQVTNTDMIVNGQMHVGNNHFPDLNDLEEPIPLPEGNHRVVVDGDNIEVFIEIIEIIQGQTVTVNLGDAELRSALLHIITNPPDANVFINGEPREGTGPVQISFGEQVIRVEAEGFIPQEQTIDVTLPISSVTFDLIELARMATIIIFTHPTNAQIFIDNEFVGYSAVTTDIAPGTRSITARLPGHIDTTVERTIAPEEEDFVHLLLTPGTNPARDPMDGMEHPMPDPIPSPTPTPTPTPSGPVPLPTIPPFPDTNPFPTATPTPIFPDFPSLDPPLPTLPPLQTPPPTNQQPEPTPWNPFV